MSRPALLDRFATGRLVTLFALATVVPLGLLTMLSLRLAADAVREEVEARLKATASITAALVGQELEGLSQIVESYAERPQLQGAVARRDQRTIRIHLSSLRDARPGIYTTFIADSRGKLVDIVPRTPSIVGKDFSFRDWYRGVARTNRPYVSEAYRTQARGNALVVAVAAPLPTRYGSPRENGGIIVAAYSLEHLQQVSNKIATAHGARLKVTDQRGVLVAEPGEPVRRLISRRDDPRVVAALRGESGVLELDTPDGRRLSAHAPVPRLGWTVTASVPAGAAFTAIARLRSSVLTVATVLGMVLAASLLLLARALRERKQAYTKLARQNERLLEVDRLKDELVSLVSHELRTPLTSIQGYLDLVLAGRVGELTSAQRKHLEVARRNATRLGRIVEDLLLIARADAGRLTFEASVVDLRELAAEAVENARVQAEAKRTVLALAPGAPCRVAVDPGRMGQVLDNLLSNAVKFTPAGGRIDVTVEQRGSLAAVEVRDSGIGIPASELADVFERFFRASTATAIHIPGVGLGLAISKAIVEAHGGTIECRSEEGTGTTFRIMLPTAARADSKAREAA